MLGGKYMKIINKSDYNVKLNKNQIKDVLMEIELVNVTLAFVEKYLK